MAVVTIRVKDVDTRSLLLSMKMDIEFSGNYETILNRCNAIAVCIAEVLANPDNEASKHNLSLVFNQATAQTLASEAVYLKIPDRRFQVRIFRGLNRLAEVRNFVDGSPEFQQMHSGEAVEAAIA